jgi:hypothetical protein
LPINGVAAAAPFIDRQGGWVADSTDCWRRF